MGCYESKYVIVKGQHVVNRVEMRHTPPKHEMTSLTILSINTKALYKEA